MGWQTDFLRFLPTFDVDRTLNPYSKQISGQHICADSLCCCCLLLGDVLWVFGAASAAGVNLFALNVYQVHGKCGSMFERVFSLIWLMINIFVLLVGWLSANHICFCCFTLNHLGNKPWMSALLMTVYLGGWLFSLKGPLFGLLSLGKNFFVCD